MKMRERIRQMEKTVPTKQVRAALERLKTRNVICPGDMPVVVWRCLGESVVDF